MTRIALFSCAFVLGALGASTGCSSEDTDPETPATEPGPLRITTDKGEVEGALVGTTRTFLGIPFAAPPTGDLRWKPPAPAEPWAETLKATARGAFCPQISPAGSSEGTQAEDCLTVNVWTPERPASEAVPVMVWIHGGGFLFGSGGEAAYDGQKLSEATGAVVVTLNYRLGPLGFLSLPELSAEDTEHSASGAYGIEDQRAALEWVKANIAAFGGDPGRVTLFGESAGGASVCIHLTSPRSRGLFQRAILESGPCDLRSDQASAQEQGALLVEALGCQGAPDVLACLREVPAEEVLSALPASVGFSMEGAWQPVIDGWNIPASPAARLASGDFERVPTIVGANADEATLIDLLGGGIDIPDEEAFAALMDQFVPGQGEAVVARYPSATYGSAKAAALAALGDAAFVCPTRKMARDLSAGGTSTYLYHFTYAPPNAAIDGLGAFHSAEVNFVFGNPSQLLPQPFDEEERSLSAAVMGYWSGLAESGEPGTQQGVTWPRYDAASDEALILDLDLATETGVRKDLCDFWDEGPAEAP
ncbi:carboxylesterase/lipase family protein [Chondromyces apiculatus]|nr:carboxylesterase family protein [Chondromyces apiculatus]